MAPDDHLAALDRTEQLVYAGLKRIKAELINLRSRTLGPLQSGVSETEEMIIRLERQVEQDTQSLIDASVKGDGESIGHLSRSFRDTKQEIYLLFNKLEELSEELYAKTKEFEEKMETMKASGV